MVKDISLGTLQFSLWEIILGPKQTEKFINQIQNSQVCILGDININYDLSSVAYKTFLPKDLVPSQESVESPYNCGSDLIEFWNTDENLKAFAQQTLCFNPCISDLTSNLDFNVIKFYDRIGNLLIFTNHKDISADIICINDHFCVLGVWMKSKFKPNQYIATIEAWIFNEIIEKKICVLQDRWTDLRFSQNFDFLNIEIFRLKDGMCVFSQRHIAFIKELSFNFSTLSYFGKFTNKRITQPVFGFSRGTQRQVKISEISPITKFQHERYGKQKQRNKANHCMAFRPGPDSDAINYFCKEFERICEGSKEKIIYLAEPYILSGKLHENLYIGLIKIFLKYSDVEFRILTHRPKLIDDGDTQTIGAQNVPSLSILRSVTPKLTHVHIRLFDDNPFHDRWICSENDEIGFSNSLNNFKRGVVFFDTYDYFFQLSKQFWNNRDTNSEEVFL